MSLPRGLRNNNPLNIRYSPQNRWQGQVCASERTDKEFCEFVTMSYGFRAALKLIQRYIRQYRLTTPSAIIARWAPPEENDTDAYIRHVCRYTGIGGEEHLAYNDPRLPNLVMAMAVMENGEQARYHRAALEEAWDSVKATLPNPNIHH